MAYPSDNDSLDMIIHEPAGTARACIIWLHGLGADGHDFEPLMPYLDPANSLGIRYIFPHAPYRPVTINGGMTMRAWYDISDEDLLSAVDETGIRHAVGLVTGLISAQIRQGIAADRIIVAGFSQGGVIALHSALRYPESLGGVIALSCYLPLQAGLSSEMSAGNSALPIFVGHGAYDRIAPLSLADHACDWLAQTGHRISRHVYAMEHSTCMEEVSDIGNWLNEVLAQT